MQDAPRSRATYADVIAAPEHMVAEIFRGELVLHPRPAPRHSSAIASLTTELAGAFQRARRGPSDWVFAIEPELHLGDDVVVPDIAGWRRSTMPAFPSTAYIETRPDWLCEVLSRSTEKYDRTVKSDIYHETGVPVMWFVNPLTQVLEVFARSGQHWQLDGTFVGNAVVTAPPFETFKLELDMLWPFGPDPDYA
jgi:Uma2 family endonuclease